MIDWTQARMLQQEIGTEQFEEVVRLFLDEMELLMERLDHAEGATQLQEVLHALKGSALTLGFAHFAELCAAAERHASLGQTIKVDKAGITSAYRQSHPEFITGLKALAA